MPPDHRLPTGKKENKLLLRVTSHCDAEAIMECGGQSMTILFTHPATADTKTFAVFADLV
jgi:hypothetical protein